MSESRQRSSKPASRSSKSDSNSSTTTIESVVSNGTELLSVESSQFNMDWWYEERGSVSLLFFLYVLQGIPLGLAGSIPMLLAVSIRVFKHQTHHSIRYCCVLLCFGH